MTPSNAARLQEISIGLILFSLRIPLLISGVLPFLIYSQPFEKRVLAGLETPEKSRSDAQYGRQPGVCDVPCRSLMADPFRFAQPSLEVLSGCR
jgi:hypothetical protein